MPDKLTHAVKKGAPRPPLLGLGKMTSLMWSHAETWSRPLSLGVSEILLSSDVQTNLVIYLALFMSNRVCFLMLGEKSFHSTYHPGGCI